MLRIEHRGVAAALASAVLFGVSTPIVKILVGSVPPLMLAGLLYAGSGIGLALFCAVRRMGAGRRVPLALPRGADRLWLAGAVFFGGVLGPMLLTSGLARSTASTASLLLNLEAVFTALLAWFLFGENRGRRVALGLLCIVAGSLLLTGIPSGRIQGATGGVLVALACLCWGIDNNLTRKVALNDAALIAGIKGVIAGTVNLGLAALLGQALPPAGALALAMIVGFFGYGLSLVLFVIALRHLGSARAGAYFAVAPFFGTVVSVLLLGDSLSPALMGAGLLMAVGVWLHLSERHGHRHSHEPLEHVHTHEHDEHHQHDHDFPWDGQGSHTHTHVHAPMVHAHIHHPDAHHRHRHRSAHP
jgi:drug/metabolite transporter (DMT)-like permease